MSNIIIIVEAEESNFLWTKGLSFVVVAQPEDRNRIVSSVAKAGSDHGLDVAN